MRHQEGDIVVGVFGSAFNPPHLGHMDAIRQALNLVDQVIVVPSVKHAFGKQMYSFASRIEMLETILDETFPGVYKERIMVSKIEEVIAATCNTAPVYTYDVLSALDVAGTEYGVTRKLKFIIGPDNAAPHNWCRFFKHDEIADRWGLIVVKEDVNIRSTAVREVLKQDIDTEVLIENLKPSTGEKLAKYLAHHKGELCDHTRLQHSCL